MFWPGLTMRREAAFGGGLGPMARRERRDQPRIPLEVEIMLDPRIDGAAGPIQMNLRTRNINIRGLFLDLPEIDPKLPWASGEWWNRRRVRIHAQGPPLTNDRPLDCDAEVRWVQRRGSKRRAVGVGLLFLQPTDLWLEALQGFLDSLVA